MNLSKNLIRVDLIILGFNLLMNPVQADFSSNSQESAFRIYILNEALEYSEGQLWNALKNVDLNKSLFLITEHDIDSYNWQDQSIILNELVSDELLKHVFKDGFSREKRHTWSRFEYALSYKQFLVMLKEEKLYGGLFLYLGTATSTSYPVIYPKVARITSYKPLKLKIRLVLRPETASIIGPQPSYKMLDLSLKKRIEIPEIYHFFNKLDKLTHQTGFCYDDEWIPENVKCIQHDFPPFPKK
ncbi:MAG: hypothetical protein VSS75_001555 [Candidatus Parabeggiatoa sp.]|nr:hypothetical protein [Candidatus Parabeggiatoa sp.]